MAKSRSKKKPGPIDVRTARKLETFGKLAAFLDGFDGHPLDGIIEWFRQGWPMGLFTEAEAECIRKGYNTKRGEVT